jgi:hypothetical protein
LFIPTDTEVNGTHTFGYHTGFNFGTGAQYPIFALAPTNRCALYNGSRYWYWTGSPSYYNSACFTYVGNSGDASIYDMTFTDSGVRFAFYL